MKNYRLNTALLLMGIVADTAICTFLFISGLWAPGCLVAIVTVFLIILGLWHNQTELINIMSSFVSALEMHDTTMRFEIGGDKKLRKMSESMNRITGLYNDNLKDLQTSKLYYDRVLKIMTHEIRNGITPIAAIAADMKKNPGRYSEDRLAEASDLLYQQAEGIRRFLDSYHALTHLPPLHKETISARAFFDNLKKLLEGELDQREITENIVSYTVPEQMTIDIDAMLMNQVMINLLRNSLDAIAMTDDDREGKIEIILTVSDSRPCITVKDNGCGMTEEVLENQFQPFYTTKEHGSGVGLSICRQIIRLHGGEINIRSLQGKGTSVIISL